MKVFISNEKLHVSAYSGHHQVLTTFLLGLLHQRWHFKKTLRNFFFRNQEPGKIYEASENTLALSKVLLARPKNR